MGCVLGEGGQYTMVQYIHPPSKNIQEQYLFMESSDNLALRDKTFTYHRQYY